MLNPWNIDGLVEIERDTGQKVNTILQLRLHPVIQTLKRRFADSTDQKADFDLTYVKSRGKKRHYLGVSGYVADKAAQPIC